MTIICVPSLAFIHFLRFSFGYGFVNYATPEDAAKAIEQLNGKSVQHKCLKVAYSQPSGSQTKNINLHVSGLPPHTNEETLREQFQQFGKLNTKQNIFMFIIFIYQ